MRTEFDAVIIGSGAGGAPIAHELVRKGKSVLVIEKGPLFRTQYQSSNGLSDFKRDELFATGSEKRIRVPDVRNHDDTYYSSHVEPDLNDEPHVYRDADGSDRATIEGYTAQVVGGGTQLYGGVSLRYSERDLRLRSANEGRTDLQGDPNGEVIREARDWAVSYDQLEPYYCKAEELVGLNGTSQGQIKRFSRDSYQKPLIPNPISRYVEVGMDALHMARYRTPLAVITQDHAPSGRKAPANPEDAKTSFVNRYGDPLGLKSSAWVSLLAPISDQPNFELRPNCVVTHVTCTGDRVSGVHYLDPGGVARTVSGKVIVVACSAIESVRLLELSALADQEFDRRIHQNDLLGAYFLTHCFGGASGVMPERCDKSLALDSDWATDHCATDAFLAEHGLWAGGAIYNNTSDTALPLSLARTQGSQDMDTMWKAFIEDTSRTGDRLVELVDGSFGKRLSVSFMANQVPVKTNRIALHPSVKDKWGRPVAYIEKGWHKHDEHLMDAFADQCGRIIQYGGDGGKGQYPIEGKGGVYQATNAAARIANHVLGGARFGTDERDSVLDPNCRAWHFDNLYVSDGAFMPTSGGGNPTLTIEANSFRVADQLLTRL